MPMSNGDRLPPSLQRHVRLRHLGRPAPSHFVARDRIGEKPLYYYHDRNRLIFASEIKSILADPSVPRQLNPRGLANFLAWTAVPPETIYRNVFKLLPGHYLITEPDSVRFRTVEYWDVGAEPQLPPGRPSPKKPGRTILSSAGHSVRPRMIADVPVGAFLSGGMDSSGVVALMKRHATGPVKTFSLGFDIGGRYNELSDARRVADYLGTEHHELHVDHVDFVQILRTWCTITTSRPATPLGSRSICSADPPENTSRSS